MIPETLADLNFPEGEEAQKQSNRFVLLPFFRIIFMVFCYEIIRFLWQLIGLSLFYMVPAYQLVIAYLKFLEISGNQDLCYYNHLCSWPAGILRSIFMCVCVYTVCTVSVCVYVPYVLCMSVCICMCVYVCMYCIYVYVHMCACVCSVCVCICMYFVCVSIYIVCVPLCSSIDCMCAYILVCIMLCSGKV